MVHLGHHQTNKVIITQGPPKRSGCPLIDKTSNIECLDNASYTRGTETAEVECLWLRKDPKCVPKYPDDNTAAAKLLEFDCTPLFIPPPLLCMRDSCDII